MSERKLVRGDELEFPSNSKKLTSTERKKIQPVINSAGVIKKPKTFGQKLSETFFGDDTRNVGDYVIHDILIPALKSTLSDAVGGGIEMLLFGERRSGSRGYISRDRDRSYIPYNRITRTSRDVVDNRYLNRSARSRHDFDDLIIPTRAEAEDVLFHLADLIADYQIASVADYYELVGIESSYTDQKYGWTNVADAFVERVREGYVIRLPKPREIT
jgi:hypothetical protein